MTSGQDGKVCKLGKSLYGLKKAPKQCDRKFDHSMIDSGFKINNTYVYMSFFVNT